jgi:ATPase subunit of ABC transporter with duplicated ATPase domains
VSNLPRCFHLTTRSHTGKSTLLKLMVGDLDPLDGMVKRHNHLRIGQYHQHLTELLPMDVTPLEYMVRRRHHCEELARIACALMFVRQGCVWRCQARKRS